MVNCSIFQTMEGDERVIPLCWREQVTISSHLSAEDRLDLCNTSTPHAKFKVYKKRKTILPLLVSLNTCMPRTAASQKDKKGKSEAITFFTDLVGRLTRLNTFTVYIHFKYILF